MVISSNVLSCVFFYRCVLVRMYDDDDDDHDDLDPTAFLEPIDSPR